MVSERNHVPRILSGEEDLVIEAESLVDTPIKDRDEATAQATFEKVVYEELGTPFKYRSVAVLAVHWAEYLDEELKCHTDVEEVRTLFEKQFRFKFETLPLHDKKKPQAQLNLGISQFIHDYDGDCRTNLLILYYTGHGDHHSDEDGLHIRGVRQPGRIGPAFEARARWKPVEEFITAADADVLAILDTCSAGSAVKGSSENTKVFEVLAATGRRSATAAPGQKSFTRAMIDSLKDHLTSSNGTPTSTYDLNQAIMRRRKNQTSQVFSRSGGQRFVKLAPLVTNPYLRAPTVPRASVSLTLRFVFANSTTLTAEQAKLLATALSRSLTHSEFTDTGLQPTAIDWVDFLSIAGGSGSADAARLQESVKKVQRLWRASSAWRGVQQDSGQKHEREDEHEVARGQMKRRCGITV